MVEFQPSKLATWVRFPSPAPKKTSPSFSAMSFLVFRYAVRESLAVFAFPSTSGFRAAARFRGISAEMLEGHRVFAARMSRQIHIS